MSEKGKEKKEKSDLDDEQLKSSADTENWKKISPDENEVTKQSTIINSRIKRYNERDRRRSIEYKKIKKENKYWAKEDEILRTHIPYNGDGTKSPHILINKWFHRLKKNCIVLKDPREEGDRKNCKIFYEIDFVGENVK